MGAHDLTGGIGKINARLPAFCRRKQARCPGPVHKPTEEIERGHHEREGEDVLYPGRQHVLQA